ncbi:hypothetical protein M2335_002649 [Sphingobium sp. B12D2B]|nr:hypothetical protein [Sphingobium sp. B12D2B]
MKGTCSYCGDYAQLSKEHFFPKWSRKAFPIYGTRSKNRFTGEIKTKDAGTRTVNSICSSCNGGWMSGVQSTAQPIIGPMIKGEWQDLSLENFRTVRDWCVMTACTYDCDVGSHEVIPRDIKKLLETREDVSNYFDVWLGIHYPFPNRGIIRIGLENRDSSPSTMTTIQIGAFVAVILYNHRDISEQMLLSMGLVRISSINIFNLPTHTPAVMIDPRSIPNLYTGGRIPPFP